MLLPNWGPLPQISHTCAMTGAPNLSIVYDWDPCRYGPKTARRLTGVSRAGSQSVSISDSAEFRQIAGFTHCQIAQFEGPWGPIRQFVNPKMRQWSCHARSQVCQ